MIDESGITKPKLFEDAVRRVTVRQSVGDQVQMRVGALRDVDQTGRHAGCYTLPLVLGKCEVCDLDRPGARRRCKPACADTTFALDGKVTSEWRSAANPRVEIPCGLAHAVRDLRKHDALGQARRSPDGDRNESRGRPHNGNAARSLSISDIRFETVAGPKSNVSPAAEKSSGSGREPPSAKPFLYDSTALLRSFL